MADTTPQAELDLRRRARRRLVGAIALALLAVVVLPMVFDPEPRPLGDQVEIRIPDQKTPFEPAAVPAPEPVSPATEAVLAEPVPAAKTEAKPAPASPPVAKPATKPETKPAAKPETAKPEAKAAPEPAPKPGGAYYLQLGVFSSHANAGQMVAKAKAAGFKASAVEDGKQYRVRVGPITERARALDYQAKLKAKGVDNVLVEP